LQFEEFHINVSAILHDVRRF